MTGAFGTRYHHLMPKPIINGLQMAAALGIDPKTLRKWIREGKCPVAPIHNVPPLRWRRADVEAFLGRSIA